MKRLSFKILPLLALAGWAITTTALQAQSPTPPPAPSNDGDVFFGVRATSGTGSSFDYLVDLGQASQFRNRAFNAVVSLGNFGSDLSNIFGSDWYTRVDATTQKTAVLFALIGAQSFAGNSDPDSTIYTSNPAQTAYFRGSDSLQSSTSTLVDGMRSGYDNSSATTPGSNNKGAQQDKTGNGSYATYQSGGSQSGGNGTSFQQFTPADEGQTNSTLTFDRVLSSSTAGQRSTNLGSFALASDGTLSFTAIPEPSTYATVICSGGLLLLIMKRKQRAPKTNPAS